jgi:hypothetical protein
VTWILAILHSFAYLVSAVVAVPIAGRASLRAPVAASAILAAVAFVIVWFGSAESAPLNRPRRFSTPLITTAIVSALWLGLAISARDGGLLWDLRTTGTYLGTLFVVGGLLGSVSLALYLIGASYLGRNLNELFTAVRSAEYKNFLRMKIDESRRLHVWALGIRDPGSRRASWDEEGNLLIDGRRPTDDVRPNVEVIDHFVIDPGGG